MKPKWLLKILSTAFVLALVLITLAGRDSLVAAQDGTTKIEQLLLDKLTSKGSADFIVRFIDQADLSAAYPMDWQARGEFVYDALLNTAAKSQANARAILDSSGLKYQTFIGGNDLYVWNGTRLDANALAALTEVSYIRATRTYYIDPIEITVPQSKVTWAGDYLVSNLLTTVDNSIEATTDWGITDSKADQAWSLGARGLGVKVANIDTGVQWDHPALVNQFACTSGGDPDCWYDPSNICGGTACDNSGHGTHTMGTMVAKDDQALPYIAGMAPDATWIACKGCESNSCSSYALTSCADWILAPGGDSANRPNLVNNSWGGGNGDDWYLAYVNAWRAAGIFPAFSAGNAGPGCSTISSPGDYQESFASAAHASNRTIASFSSRGPSSFGHDPYTKPNISAPGVSICSTVPTSNWSCGYSGTSMASPHTAGAVAQLWSCAPALVGQIDATFQALQSSIDAPPAGNCGAPPDGQGNYTYGYGYLNVLTLVNSYCGAMETGTLEGHVYDQGGNPVGGVNVTALPATEAKHVDAVTDPSGFYTMDLPVGIYNVTASISNYTPQTVYGVEIFADQTTVLDFTLTYLGSWTQIPLGSGCPDWYRYDMEYFGNTGLAYILGGRNNVSTYGDIYSFDPAGHTCSDTGTNMSTAISNYTIIPLNDGSADLLCTFGGRDASGIMTQSVQCYNPIANTVTTKANLPSAYSTFLPGGAAVVNNKAYIFGGFRSTSAPYNHAYTYEYDPLTDAYTQKGNLSLARGYIIVGMVDGLIYAFGGDTFDGASLIAQTKAEVFTPTSGTWNDAAVADLTTASGEGRAFGFDTNSGFDLAGKIILAGGGIWSSDTYAVLSYGVATNSYDDAFPDLNVERRDHAGFFVPGNPGVMWVSGGFSAAVGYGGDNPPYAPPEYFEVSLIVPPEPDINLTPNSLHASLYPDTSIGTPITIANLGNLFLDWAVTDDVGWLSENPTSGSVDPGSSAEVMVTFNATGLVPGQYTGSVTVNSNDPDEPAVTIPATLEVLPLAPNIVITAPALEMTLLHDQSDSIAIYVGNNGLADLAWSATDTASWLSEIPDSGIVQPGYSAQVLVTFDSAGLALGDYFTDLVINSNDPDQPEISLPVVLHVVEPDIFVSGPPLEMTLPPDQTATLYLTISNLGTTELFWSTTDGVPWLSENPDNGVVEPGDSNQVQVIFDSTGLVQGEYLTDLVISSNDPDQPSISLPVTLTVTSPDIEITAPPLDMTLFPDQSAEYNLVIANFGDGDLIWTIGDGAEWLDENPSSGTLLPNHSVEVVVTFDSTGLQPGLYQTEVLISSNDPDEPQISLPASLYVVEPDINIIAPALNLELMPDETRVITFTIENKGNWDLSWSLSELPAVPWLAEDPLYGTIQPSELITVEVTFNSAGMTYGLYETEIQIASNDQDEPVIILPVTLTVLSPDINILSPGLDVSLFPGETQAISITLQNSGNSELQWNATDEASWLMENPTDGTVGPAGMVDVQILFNSAGLTPGEYSTVVIISSNDPDEPTVSLPATLTVLAHQSDLAVEKTASANEIFVGDPLTYTLIITNFGPQEAPGVVLTDTLPVMVTFVSASPECSFNAGVVTCNVGQLGVDESITLTIEVIAISDGTANNTVLVSSENPDPDQANNTSTVLAVIHPLFHQIYMAMIQKH